MRLAAVFAVLLLAGCGPRQEESIEPVPQATPESADALMGEAERAAGNAQARMNANGATTDNLVEARR